MEIKMVDLQSQYQKIKPEIDSAIQRVLDSTAFIQGPEVQSFTEALSRYLSSTKVVTCANGTDALQIAMMALELKAGDEVILPVHTYVATAEVLALLKLRPVFVDVEQNTFNIDISQIESKISEKTRAIVPVHLYGQCANMEAITSLAIKFGLFVIEDAAQALGAEFVFSNGLTKKAGTIGTIGTTSFFPSKNLGCFGDGGAIFTNDTELTEKIKKISNHGQRIKYHHDLIGVNSRLDTIQAAILQVKLKYLDEYALQRNKAAERYDRLLQGIKEVSIPTRASYSTHVFHQYTLVAEERDKLKSYLENQGIPTMIYYPIPLHLQKAYRQDNLREGSFPVAEELARSVISLPIHTEMKVEEQEYISEKIKSFYCG